VKKLLSTSLAAVLAFAATNCLFAQSGQPVVQCKANLSLPGMPPNVLAVRITRTGEGKFQSQINGTVSNSSFNSVESRIRGNFNLKVDPYSPDARNLNPGEVSLAHLESIRELADIPFDLRNVRRTVIYDLQGTTDKYGGTVLIEAYGANNMLLGRVLRSLMAATCS
jgi:hypothetical protein